MLVPLTTLCLSVVYSSCLVLRCLLQMSQYVGTGGLKHYFQVDTQYVLKKLRILLFPFVPGVSTGTLLGRGWTSLHMGLSSLHGDSPMHACVVPSVAFLATLSHERSMLRERLLTAIAGAGGAGKMDARGQGRQISASKGRYQFARSIHSRCV